MRIKIPNLDSEKKQSFIIRLQQSVYEKLSHMADKKNVSVNKLVSAVLSDLVKTLK